MTRVVPIDPDHPQQAAIAQAAEVLRGGGLVAFPTETVYGLGAMALDADAVRGIFAAKGRPPNDPIIAHIADLSHLDQLTINPPALISDIAAAFWPGPLTLVMRRGPRVPRVLTAGGDTVAVRMPDHAVPQALIDEVGPLAAPSANRFARPSPTTADHVLVDLYGDIPMILDGGPTRIGLESTVLDLTRAVPTVLRPGGVALEDLKRVLTHVEVLETVVKDDQTAPSPGTMVKHYAPDARVMAFDGPRRLTLAALHDAAEKLLEQGQRVGALLFDEDAGAVSDLALTTRRLGDLDNLEESARNLFSGLRALDDAGVDVIVVRLPGDEGVGLAIRDRLARAAEGQVIQVEG